MEIDEIVEVVVLVVVVRDDVVVPKKEFQYQFNNKYLMFDNYQYCSILKISVLDDILYH